MCLHLHKETAPCKTFREKTMNRNCLVKSLAACALAAATTLAFASLNPITTWTGNGGLSADGVGSTAAAVGDVQTSIPVGASILQAYLYSAGTPVANVPGSPTTLAAYNGAGITFAGTAINNFNTLVGATSPRADIGRFYPARADGTSL